MAIINTLTWTPNTEKDMASYNVYRHIGSTAPVKIGNVIHPTATFTDTDTGTDGDYNYFVTAVDTSKNESVHSVEVVKTVNVNPPLAPVGLNVV